jgi:hypothetical protein
MSIGNEKPEPSDEDVEYGSKVTGLIEDRYGYDEVMRWDEGVPLEFRIVAFAWSAVGHGEVNGYVAFLMMECRHSALAVCFDELGLPDLAVAIRELLAPIPDEALGDEERLEEHFGGWENFASWVSKFEPGLFEAFSRIIESIASYCRSRVEIFSRLDPGDADPG